VHDLHLVGGEVVRSATKYQKRQEHDNRTQKYAHHNDRNHEKWRGSEVLFVGVHFAESRENLLFDYFSFDFASIFVFIKVDNFEIPRELLTGRDCC